MINNWQTPSGMSRRHFMQHLAGSSAVATASMTMGGAIKANADELRKNGKSAILLWMGGGPATIDIWDLAVHPPVAVQADFNDCDMQICEHMPLVAQQMKHSYRSRHVDKRGRSHAWSIPHALAMCPIQTLSTPVMDQ